MQHEVAQEALKASPAVAVVVAHKVAGLQISEWVAILTGLYIVMQMAYLGWKWWREAHRKEPSDEADR